MFIVSLFEIQFFTSFLHSWKSLSSVQENDENVFVVAFVCSAPVENQGQKVKKTVILIQITQLHSLQVMQTVSCKCEIHSNSDAYTNTYTDALNE